MMLHFLYLEKHINIRAALIHVLGDLLQSIGVLFSSVLIKIFGESCKVKVYYTIHLIENRFCKANFIAGFDGNLAFEKVKPV